MKPTFLSLFSGAGGLDLGLHRAGWECVGQCEADPWRRTILARHWPDIPQWDDVQTLNPEALLMPASKLTDTQFEEAIQRYLDGESVEQIADHLPITRQALWERFKRRGVPMREQQRRGADNHFYRGGPRGADWAHNKVEKAVKRGDLTRPKRCSECGGEGEPYKDGRSPIQAHHDDYNRPLAVRWLCQRCHHEWHKHNEPLPLRKEVAREVSTVDLIAGGFPLGHAKTCPWRDDGKGSRVNEQACSGTPSASSSLFDLDSFSWRTYPDCSPATAVGTSESCLERWPTSGTAWDGGLSIAVSSECRSADGVCSSSEPSLADVLEPNAPARFSLSARAATGILRRAERRGRELPPTLLTALRELSLAGTPKARTAPPTTEPSSRAPS